MTEEKNDIESVTFEFRFIKPFDTDLIACRRNGSDHTFLIALALIQLKGKSEYEDARDIVVSNVLLNQNNKKILIKRNVNYNLTITLGDVLYQKKMVTVLKIHDYYFKLLKSNGDIQVVADYEIVVNQLKNLLTFNLHDCPSEGIFD